MLKDEHNHIKISDFGLSRKLEIGNMETYCGTPAYMVDEFYFFIFLFFNIFTPNFFYLCNTSKKVFLFLKLTFIFFLQALAIKNKFLKLWNFLNIKNGDCNRNRGEKIL